MSRSRTAACAVTGLVLMLALVVNVAKPADAVATGSDNFDSKFSGQNPSAPFYTYTAGSGGFATSNAHAHSAPNGALVCDSCASSGATGASFNFGTVPSNVDTGVTYSFWFYFAVGANAPQSFRMAIGPSADFVLFSPVGSPVTSYTANAGHCIQTFPGTCSYGATLPGITMNAWHQASVAKINACGNSEGFLFAVDGAATQDTTSYCGASDSPNYNLRLQFTPDQPGCQNCPASPAIWIDDLAVSGASASVPIVGAPVTSATFTGIVGFDMDASGATVILRTNSGGHVRTLDAATLTGNSDIDTHCARVNGVATLPAYTTFLQCWDSDGYHQSIFHYKFGVRYLSIRNAALAAPNVPNICHDGDFCDMDIDTVSGQGALAGDNELMSHLATVQAFPYDFSISSSSGINHVRSAWAYTDVNGNAGVVTYMWRNNAIDKSDYKAVSITPTHQVPDQLCTVQDLDGKQYFYASSSTSTVKGFLVTFDTNAGLTLDPIEYFNVDSITTTFAGTGSTANAAGVACGHGRFAVLTTSNVQIFLRGANSPYKTITGLTGVQPAGIAMSDDGKYLGYVSAGKWHVVNANGTEKAQGTMPSGNFKGIRLDGFANNVWIATETNVYKWPVFTYTTGNDTAYNLDDPANNPNAPHGSNGNGNGGGSGSGSSASATEQFIWFAIATFLGVLLAWYFTGGRLTDGKVAPGNPTVIGAGGYLGMWAGVILWAGDFWWIPTLLPIGGLAFIWFVPKGKGS